MLTLSKDVLNAHWVPALCCRMNRRYAISTEHLPHATGHSDILSLCNLIDDKYIGVKIIVIITISAIADTDKVMEEPR